MGQVYHLNIPIDGTEVAAQPNWRPQGLIVSNFCDAVIRVDDGRGTVYRVPTGTTIRRPIFTAGHAYRCKTETEATTGEALIVLTSDPIVELAGEDASLARLYRREMINGTFSTLAAPIQAVVDPVIGGARYMQLAMEISVLDASGRVDISITDTSQVTPFTIAGVTIRQTGTAGNNVPVKLSWTFGQGCMYFMPFAARLNYFVASGGGQESALSIIGEVWE